MISKTANNNSRLIAINVSANSPTFIVISKEPWCLYIVVKRSIEIKERVQLRVQIALLIHIKSLCTQF